MKKKNSILVVFAFILIISYAHADTSIFSDNFNDLSIADWTTDTGAWSAATGSLVGGGADPSSIGHYVGTTAGRTYKFAYKNNPNVASLNNHFAWFTDQNGFAAMSGYRLVIQSGTSRLQRADAGIFSDLFTFAGVSTGVVHDINVTHTWDGNIQVWVDGVSMGSSGDATYNRGNRLTIGNSNGAANGIWDDINILITGDTNETFRIVDEEFANVGLQATVKIDGIAQTVGVDGNFDVNAAAYTFPITIDVNFPNYDARSFYFDTNDGLHEIRRFGLRAASESQDISFQFYDPNKTTLLNNRIIKAIRIPSLGTNKVLSGRILTSSTATGFFNLNSQDSSYDFNIMLQGFDANIGNQQYKYDAISLTLVQPKDERTNTPITIWSATVGGLGTQVISNTAAGSANVILLGNTLQTYDIQVDENTLEDSYFARMYSTSINGNDLTATLQPYLIKRTDGSSIIVKAIDIPTNVTIQGVRVQLRRGINGVNTLVEDRITNLAGIAEFSMLSQQDYNISFFNVPLTISYLSGIASATSNFTATINYTSGTTGFTPIVYDIDVAPIRDTLVTATQKIDVNASVNRDMNRIIIQLLDGNTIRYESIVSSAGSLNTSFNANLNSFDTNTLILLVVFELNDLNRYYSKFYNIGSLTTTNVVDDLRSLQKNFNPLNLLVIGLLIVFAFVGIMGNNLFGNNDAQAFVVAIGLGLVVLILFQAYIIYFMAALVLGAAAWIWLRSVR